MLLVFSLFAVSIDPLLMIAHNAQKIEEVERQYMVSLYKCVTLGGRSANLMETTERDGFRGGAGAGAGAGEATEGCLLKVEEVPVGVDKEKAEEDEDIGFKFGVEEPGT